MSCDPTWEVCDTPAATDASTDAPQGGKGGADGAQKQKAQAAKNVALIFANMLWSSTLASAYGVGTSSDLVSRQQANALEADGSAATATAYRDSTTWKATQAMGFMLLPWGTIGWIVFLANNLIDGKGGMFQQGTYYYVKSAGPVGILLLTLTAIRSFSRKSCDDDATAWQCTVSGDTDSANYTNSGYAQRTRQSAQLGLQMLMIYYFTETTVTNAYQKAVAAKAAEEGSADGKAKGDKDASADASTDDASSSDNAW